MYSHNFNQLKVKIKDVSLQNKTLDRQIQTIKKEIKTLACELDSQQWDGCAKAVMQGAVSKFTETGELPSTDIGMLAVKLHNMEQQKTYQEDQKQSFVDKKQDLSSRKREIIDDKIQHFDLSQEFNSTDVNNNSSRKFSDETDVYGAF
ncbi:hypothetical protein JM93_01781 [Roseibium hamelinense]|uniref:Uncharacterized protein n=1 Tax=Roseibium hamelinense TaxID=150831 RepID=A0A562T7J6_9HYPH|nr:hypothetical protein [Roseibium hamelinense]MTI42968.1 hypothetical protein [Roseibium hamelinense]TWI89577.1 hypothetical protein JM93_01781 [Roseibium hamelinense]